MGTSISHTKHLDEIEARKIRRLMKIKQLPVINK